MKTLFALTAVCGFAAAASADIQFQDLFTFAPPATLGGNPMDAAAFNPGVFADVTSADIGGGRTTSFIAPHSLRAIGSGWATWSHGYTGNVYYTNGSTQSGGNLSPGVKAFYLYAEPNPFGLFSMTVTAASPTGIFQDTFTVDGSSGAHGWGFWTTDGSDIGGWQIGSDVDFAVGEFGSSAVPAPASLGLLGLGGLVAGRRRRA